MASSHTSEEVANKAMYALARLVAGPATSARAEFYNMGRLPQLQALLGSSSGASTRVKTRAVNLISDLIGVWQVWVQTRLRGAVGQCDCRTHAESKEACCAFVRQLAASQAGVTSSGAVHC